MIRNLKKPKLIKKISNNIDILISEFDDQIYIGIKNS